MTTSGTTTFNPTYNQIIYGALRMCGAYSVFDAPKAEQITGAEEALNMMLKSWQAQNLTWLREFATLFLSSGTAVYTLPGANGAVTVVETTLDGAHAASATVLTVADSTGMTAADIVGIINEDGDLWWDVIDSVDSSTQITITTGLDVACMDGAAIYTYTTAIHRPPKIHNVMTKDAYDNETELTLLSRKEYFQKSDKDSAGTPVEYYYDPQRDAGKLYFWPTPDDETVRVLIDMDRVIEDITAVGQTFDVPQYAVEIIKYGLAVRLAPEYGLPIAERQMLDREFTSLVGNILSYDVEPASVFFEPEYE